MTQYRRLEPRTFCESSREWLACYVSADLELHFERVVGWATCHDMDGYDDSDGGPITWRITGERVVGMVVDGAVVEWIADGGPPIAFADGLEPAEAADSFVGYMRAGDSPERQTWFDSVEHIARMAWGDE